MGIDLEKLNNLSESEKEVALKILREFKETGNSKTYAELIYRDYKEIPVDIETFLKEERYLGKAWHDDEGTFKLYPFWLEELKDIFPDNVTTNYDTLLESGARGIGKSEVACGAIGAYLMYRIMCLKNPLEYYHIKNTEKIAFAFMNIKLDLAKAIAIDKFQKTIQKSSWFMEKGTMTQKDNQPYWNPPEPLEIIIGSQSDDVIGRPIYFAFFDEISFLKNQDVDKQKQKAKDMINTAKGGMKTRFIHKGKNPTLLVVASSKKSEQAFMESYIRELSENEGDNVKIIDKPVWEVKPEGTYSKETFLVGLGNRFLDNMVIPRSDYGNLNYYIEKGYGLLEMPVDFEADAKGNLERVLCDYAGISSFSSNKFMSAGRVAESIDDDSHNPLPDVIVCGNAKEDTAQYYNWFDWDKLDKKYMNRPLFIHLDMSKSKDKTGIAGVWIIGKKPTTDGNPGKDLMFKLAFSTSIEAPKGRQISFEKNRNFVRWCKAQGFKVKKITCDTYQSTDLQQILTSEGYDVDILSVDRVDNVPGEKGGVCKPYQYLKNVFYENRITMYRTKLLYNELVQLEINNNNGKVDHPDNGCFTGDTKVRLTDGRSLTFIELVDEYNSGKQNYVYSVNIEDKLIEPKPITKAWKTLENQPLVGVTFDNGEYVECTLNHKFMLRNGEYIEAQNLIPGDSMMPLYTKYPGKGNLSSYRMFYNPFTDDWHYEHRQFAKDVLDEKYLVHHIDCNPKNNNPNNLVWCSKEMHHKIHTEMQTGAQSESANIKRSGSVKKWHDEHRNTDKYTLRSKNISDAIIKFNKEVRGYDAERTLQEKENHIKEIEETFDVDYNNLTDSEKISLGVKLHRINHPEVVDRVAQKVSANHKLGKYTNARKSLNDYDNNCKILKQLYPKIDEKLFKELFDIEWSSLNKSLKGVWSNRYRQKLYELRNHKVVKIEFINKREDVYDIEVADNHNFALDCGVFVHNSKDQADAMCGATYTASSFAEEYAHDYGEDAELTLSMNGDKSNDIKNQMTVNLEEELMKMREYLNPKNIDEGFEYSGDLLDMQAFNNDILLPM